MQRTVNSEIWKNLFCFPNFKTKKIALNWLKLKTINLQRYTQIMPFNHKFSHFTLHINPIIITLSSYEYNVFSNSNKIGIWYNFKKPQKIGIPQPVQKIIKIYYENNLKK